MWYRAFYPSHVKAVVCTVSSFCISYVFDQLMVLTCACADGLFSCRQSCDKGIFAHYYSPAFNAIAKPCACMDYSYYLLDILFLIIIPFFVAYLAISLISIGVYLVRWYLIKDQSLSSWNRKLLFPTMNLIIGFLLVLIFQSLSIF